MFLSAKEIAIFLNAAGFSAGQSFNELSAQQLRDLESIIISQNPNSTSASFQIPTSPGFKFIDL